MEKIFIRKSRQFYEVNKIDRSLDKKIQNYQIKFSTHLKFEWNCKGEKYTLSDKVIAFRQSGVRVKRIDAAPTLVYLSPSATPYIPSLKRYLSQEECLKIQGSRTN